MSMRAEAVACSTGQFYRIIGFAGEGLSSYLSTTLISKLDAIN
jgi:hypothetical protein